MKLSLLIILINLLSTALLYPQVEDKALVKIGKYALSEKEYIERIEMTPLLGRKLKGENRKVNEDFLYSLIGEKLLALGAYEFGIDTLPLVKHSLKEFEKMFVRDALYTQKIITPSKAAGEERLNKYLLNPSIIFVHFIKSQSQKEINNIYSLIKLGAPFDSIYVELSNAATDTMTIGIGNLPEADEHKVFALELDEVSTPIESEGLWYIFSVKKKYDPVFARTSGWETEFKRLRKIAAERAEHDFYRDYISNFFASKQVQANGKLLHLLAQHIELILSHKFAKAGDKPDKLALDVIDLLQIEDRISADTLELTYVKLEKKILSLRDFLRFFRFEQFWVKDIEPSEGALYKSIVSTLNTKTKKFIEWELLAAEGYRLGLNKTADVVYQTNMWRENYLFTLMRSNFADSTSASEAEYQNYYEINFRSKKTPQLVNIIEVLTDSLSIAGQVLDELEKGVDIKELARQYSKREWTKSSDGEFGYFPVNNHGELGRIAATMEIGEIYGPVSVKEGFSIFKLIGKKDEVEQLFEYDKVKHEVEQAVKYKTLNDAISKYTTSLAVKYNVEINIELFNSIKVTNINAIVFKHLGFGGKITGVPLLGPFYEWATPWLELKNQNP